MRFYTAIHKHYRGIDLHVRNMYNWVLDQGRKDPASSRLAYGSQPVPERYRPVPREASSLASSVPT